MTGRLKIISILFNAAIFIALEIAALSMLRNNGALQDTWVMKGFHAVYAYVWGKSESIKHYFSLNRENRELAMENFMLSGQARHYREMYAGLQEGTRDSSAEVARADAAPGRFRYAPASIIKISNNKQHNFIIVDKGAEDGITPQSGIITEKGVIGIISAVSRHYSYAISFRNTGMTVSARIGRTGPVGSLTWDGKSTCGALLNEIPHHIGIEKGDTVYTSGFSSIFPPDIPLGTVGESRIVNGATYEIKVGLFEDFKALRYVTLVHNTGKEEIKQLVSGQ